MYEEDKYSAFDRSVHDMLYDAQEEVPSRVWGAVSGRMKSRRYSAGWTHPVIGMACAAALALGVVFTPRIIEGLQRVDSREPLLCEAPGLDVTTVFPGTVTLTERSGRIQAEAEDGSIAPESEVMDLSEAAPATQDARTASPVAASKRDDAAGSHQGGPDPLDLLAYEESQQHSRRLRTDMDIRGVVSSNDDITMGVKQSRMMAKSGSGSYASGISQSSEDTFGIPVSFQVGARIFVNDWLGFGAGISYSLLTRSFTGNLIEGGAITHAGLDILHTAQYVGVPLNVYISIIDSNRTRIYAFAGGTGEKCVSSRYDLRVCPDPSVITERVDALQWSAGLGFGMQYDITPHLGFYIDPSARYYFDCGQPRTVRSSKPFMFDFAVGLRFNL